MNGHTPDINGNYTFIGAAATSVVVWTLSLAGIDMPAEVATSVTTLFAVGLGVVMGKSGKNRRSSDHKA